MGPYDPRLSVLAAQARVKTCHVFHLVCALKETGKSFHKEAFAVFTGLEVHHVERMLEALQEHDAIPTRQREASTKGHRLPDDWAIPDDWMAWAVRERRWHPADIREEAEIFANYWQARSGKDACKLDWRKTWMNWVRNSRRANGDYVPEKPKQSKEQRIAWLRENIAFRRRVGQEWEAQELERELSQLEGNVLPFQRSA